MERGIERKEGKGGRRFKKEKKQKTKHVDLVIAKDRQIIFSETL